SVITLSNVTCAVLAEHHHGPLPVIAALAIGVGAGIANGLIVSYARIAPLIATLATSSIYLGFALIILPVPGGTVPTWLSNSTAGSVGSIPVAVFWLGGAIVVGWIVLQRT